MQNGSNGAAPASGQPVQINPLQAAQFALMFLQRTDMKPNERDAYAIAEGLLNAILSGQVVLGPAPQAVAAPPGDAAQKPGESPT